MQIGIRKATELDLEQVLELIRELALYERAPDEVWATLDDYKEGLAENWYEILVADHIGTLVGLALYYPTWSSWKGKMFFLEDLIVKEAFRGLGVGQKLFDAFIQESKKNKCKLVKWQVLDWNQPALAFYRKNNAIIEQNWWTGKILFSD